MRKISSSVAGVAAALIPLGLAGYGLDASLTWRVAAAIFLIFDNGIIASFIGAYRPVRGTFPPEQASLVAVIVGSSLAPYPALYTTALIANICQAGFIFVRFVESTFRHESDVLPPVPSPSPGDDGQDSHHG